MKLRHELHIESLTNYVISITAQGKTAADAETTANAVANSYITYVSPKYSPIGHVLARMLASATSAAGTGRLTALLMKALLGALVGVVGVVVALVISRKDRRLRERDDIANSIGLPIFASVPVGHPVRRRGLDEAAGGLQAGPVDAWQLRTALQQLGMADHTLYSGGDDGFSIAVLSFSSDLGALALGPQLAVFAASQGILPSSSSARSRMRTSRRASRRMRHAPSNQRQVKLRVTVSPDGSPDGQHDGALIIAIVVVDVQEPKLPDAMRTTAAVIGVSRLPRRRATGQGRGHSGHGRARGLRNSRRRPGADDRTSGRIAHGSQPTRRRHARSRLIATEIRR